MFRFALMVIVVGILSAHAPTSAAEEATLRRGYVDSPYGQLHYTKATPPRGAGKKTKTPHMILFHQSPNSSVEYTALVKELAKDRVVLALDTPGHGGSDGPSEIPTIEDYAAAMIVSLKNLGYGAKRPFDAFGFHTGSRIVAEIAATEPRMIRRIMMGLSGVSVSPPEEMENWLKSVYHPTSSEDAFRVFHEQLPDRIKMRDQWNIDDAFWGKMMVERLRHLTRYEYGHAAAFEYGQRFDARLAQLTQPVSLIVIDDGTKASGLFKYSAREMSEQVVDMFTSSKQAKVLPEDFSLADLYGDAAALADAFRRFQDERL